MATPRRPSRLGEAIPRHAGVAAPPDLGHGHSRARASAPPLRPTTGAKVDAVVVFFVIIVRSCVRAFVRSFTGLRVLLFYLLCIGIMIVSIRVIRIQTIHTITTHVVHILIINTMSTITIIIIIAI